MQFNLNQCGLSIPGFGPCSEPACNGTFVRLFTCAHHCTKLVCLRHLIEHDRVFERNKRQLDEIQMELGRVWSVYSSLVDETKIQREFEQKLNEHTQLAHNANMLLRSDSTDIQRFRIIIDQLKKAIGEKERQQTRSSTFVKVEPVDETLEDDIEEKRNITSLDEYPFGIRRAHRLEEVTDVNKSNQTRNHFDNSLTNNKNVFQPNNDTIIANDEEHCTIDTTFPITKISGECPLWINGAYGLSKEHHGLRLCKQAHFRLLNKHMRDFHGLSTSTTNLVARAVHSKVPITKRLFANHAQVLDSHLSLSCPFGIGSSSRCSIECRLPAPALKTHLIITHQMSNWKAKTIVEKLQGQRPDEAMKMIKKRHTAYDYKYQIG